MRVFVYGTLKSGYWNSRRFGDSTLIGPDSISGYKLVEHGRGGIPYACPYEGSTIRGEVWDIGDVDTDSNSIATLRSLDSLEGHPNGYLRVPATTITGDDVHLYTMPKDRMNPDRMNDVPLNSENEHEWTSGR